MPIIFWIVAIIIVQQIFKSYKNHALLRIKYSLYALRDELRQSINDEISYEWLDTSITKIIKNIETKS